MAGYIGSKASVVSSGAERKKVFAITTTTTSLTGLSYTVNQVHVYHNGIRLVDGTDYTATNGTSITLNSAAESGDEVVVVSYATFQVADAYTQAEADAEFVQVSGDTMTGDLNVTGTITSDGLTVDNAQIGPANTTWAYQGMSFVQGKDSSVANTTSYIDFKNNLSTPDAHVFADHLTDGSSALIFGTTPAGSRSTDRRVERMRIDGAGRVTMPYQPAFNARVNENTAYNTTGWNKITIGNLMNQRGSHYNTSTSRFTAPVSGWYHISMSVVFNAGNDNDGAISLGINGGVSGKGIGVNQSKNGGTYNGKSASGSVYMTAGDYAEVYVFITASMTTRGSIYAGYFSGHLIG